MAHCWVAEVRLQALTPTEADVRVTLVSQDLLADQEASGRFVGPRSHYASTVEVAYPLKPLPRLPEQPTRLTGRLLIPEPCFWEPATPFVYQGHVAVRLRGQRWFEAPLTLGLRTLQLRQQGLRLNGRPLRLQGVQRERLTAEEGLRLRQDGCNLLLTPAVAENAETWAIADRLGFLVIGQLQDSIDSFGCPASLRCHPSALGWLGPAQPPTGAFFGSYLKKPARENELSGMDFIVCDADQLTALNDVPRPKIVVCEQWPSAEEQSQAASSSVVGWIRR
ncbi:MAG: hypothetical protein JNM56_40580 [Planctomycetia bacterium]|nr:hypothetical protein [Planctomycetia bacterium]